MGQLFFVQLVVGMVAVFFAVDDARAAQDSQVLGDRGSGEPQDGGQGADTVSSLGQEGDDAAPAGFAQYLHGFDIDDADLLSNFRVIILLRSIFVNA